MKSLIEVITEFDVILKNKVLLFTDSITNYVIAFAVGIVLIYIGSKVIINMSTGGGKLDPYILIRPCLIIIMIVLYPQLVDLLIEKPIGLLGDIVKQGVFDVTGVTADKFESLYHGKITHVQTDGADGNGVYDIIQINPFVELAHIFIYFLASMVGAYMMFKSLLYSKIYFIVGIFAIPFSLVPGNQKVLSSWFFGYISVLLWVPVIYVMKFMIILLPIETSGFTNVLFSIALQCVLIGMILKAPTFANILVSEGSQLANSSGGQSFVGGLVQQGMQMMMYRGMSGGSSSKSSDEPQRKEY